MQFRVKLVCTVLSILILKKAQCISLDDSGYYKLVIAIDERTVQNSVENYTENLKMGIQDLSDLLHHTTMGKFSIKQAEILVPSHWNVETNGVATMESYPEADVKISHTFSLPYVNNPNPCGRSGIDIQLPYDFFDKGDTGRYGRLGKSLLVLFARLRFGVWEEHGYPGDQLFPYYWRPLRSNEWEINACTDEKLTGTYRDIDEPEAACGPNQDSLYPPPSECRFFPDTAQKSKSSLMSYHYLPTFEAFCNSSTHDRSKPTPQNYFCRYKSVMEVIEESQDWVETTKKNEAGRVITKIVKTSDLPIFYILLDSQITHVPSPILSNISDQLSTFIALSEIRDVVAGIGKYPVDDPTKSLAEIMPWTQIRDDTSQFAYVLQNTLGKDAEGLKNYGGALNSIVNKLNKRNHGPGAVILIVKTSPEPNTGSITPESEVIISLLQGKIKVFAIEVHGSSFQYSNAFERIAKISEGSHVSIRSTTDLQEPLKVFLHNLVKVLQARVEPSRKTILAQKEIAAANSPVFVRLSSRITHFEAFAMPMSGEIENVMFNGGDEEDIDTVTLNEMKYWDNSSAIPNQKKSYYYSSENLEHPYESLSWSRFSYACISGGCKVQLTILVQVEDDSLLPHGIKLSIATTAVNNEVDLATANANSSFGVPFGIYAKIEQDGVPFTPTEGLEVKAVISVRTLRETNTVLDAWIVELKDNGNGSPDITTSDGIFSAPFVAKYDELHEIYVTAKYRKPIEATTTTAPNKKYDSGIPFSSSAGKLFPIDQSEIGCGSGYLGCQSTTPNVEFFVMTELISPIRFKNTKQFIPLASRIIDLVVTPLDEYQLNLQWTDPGAITQEGSITQCDAYEIRHQEDFNELLNNFDTAQNIPTSSLPFPGPPGRRQNITYSYGFEVDRYYAIRTICNTQGPRASGISVVVGVNIRNETVTTTTTTTKTTSPQSPSTTNPPSTVTKISTTTENTISSTITSPKTTQKRTTTVRSTLKTTTMEPTTKRPVASSRKPPVKHWYQTNEGIITISVFGAGILLITVGSISTIWFLRFR